jgi:hypothetical protein
MNTHGITADRQVASAWLSMHAGDVQNGPHAVGAAQFARAGLNHGAGFDHPASAYQGAKLRSDGVVSHVTVGVPDRSEIADVCGYGIIMPTRHLHFGVFRIDPDVDETDLHDIAGHNPELHPVEACGAILHYFGSLDRRWPELR